MVKAKKVIKKYLPQKVLEYHRQYFRWKCERRYMKSIQTSLQHIVSNGGYHVQGGIFKGMDYIETATGSVLTPKLIGSYEEELHEAFHKILDEPYEVIVDIGCAEGYYTAGLAKRFPNARVYAFDSDKRSCRLTARMVRLNRVEDRVTISEWCDKEHLNRIIRNRRSFILCDCDGYEIELLQPDVADHLKYCDILVELHDHLVPDVTSTIIERFKATHEVTRIRREDRDPGNYPVLEGLDFEDKAAALSEWRPSDQQWLFLRAKIHLGHRMGMNLNDRSG